MYLKKQKLIIWLSSAFIGVIIISLIFFSLTSFNNKYIVVGLIIMLASIQLFAISYLSKTIKQCFSFAINKAQLLSEGEIPTFTAKERMKFKPIRYFKSIANSYKLLQDYGKSLNSGSSSTIVSEKKGEIIKDTLMIIDDYINNLKTESDEWKKKEDKRTWTNQGIAQFSDLLHKNRQTLNELSQSFLRQLIKYLNANQGGVFLVKEQNNNTIFEMVAAYAYDRDKYPEEIRAIDDGLLGEVYFEKQSIYMTDIPDKYINIRSGMGEAEPTCLFLVPLLSDDKVVGVVELASFNELDEHEKLFVEKIAETLASTIASTQINNTTSHLLEQSQRQAMDLQRQEEELRQNIEEMQAQQEEMEKKKDEVEENKILMSKIIDLVPYPIFVKNIKREYIVANKAQAELFSLTVDQILGKTDDFLIKSVEELNEILKTDMQVLEENLQIKLPEQSISLPNGTRKILQTIKVPFINNVTKNQNILGVSLDYTEQRELESELNLIKKKLEEQS